MDVVDSINWLELPEHITSHIISKLSCINDYTRFGAVCIQWRSVLIHGGTKLIPRQLPLLMIRTPQSQSQSGGKKNKKKNKNKKSSSSTISCSFYRVTDGKIFNRLKLNIPRERYVRGSGYGWLITVDDDNICFSVQLMNPFFYPNASTKEIKLPPLIANPNPSEETDPANITYCHLQKAVLSADPVLNPKEFMVMAIFGASGSLAFCKPGADKAWTPIKENLTGNLVGRFIDIIYYEGKFYALNYKGVVVVCNMATQMTETFAMPIMPIVKTNKKYLVESVGELFLVHRYVNDQHNTEQLHVFKLQRRRESATDWVEVKDLGDRVFFIGDSPSMSISASDFLGCKPNHIYYTDDAVHTQFYFSNKPGYGPRDLGVFDLKNGIFEKHYSTTGEPWPAPIWIEPTSIINSKLNILRNQLL